MGMIILHCVIVSNLINLGKIKVMPTSFGKSQALISPINSQNLANYMPYFIRPRW